MPQSFLESLHNGPLLCDGAMGTQLYERGGFSFERCLDELSLSQPELVKGIHLDYIRAGAQVLETNTFGANRIRLSQHGLESQVRHINQAAVGIAREAQRLTGQRVWVAGSVGPIGRPLAPPGTITRDQAQQAFREQIEVLVEAGVDLLMLETFGDLREIQIALGVVRDLCQLPVVAQMTFTEEGKSITGNDPGEVVKELESLGAHAIGANCSVGSEHMLEVVLAMASVATVPVSAQPNAGFPMYRGGRFLYHSSPQYMAQHARTMVEAGATMVGGCCGTTPEHIAATRDALQGVRVGRKAIPTRRRMAPRPAQPGTKAPAPEPTNLSRNLGRKFQITVEVDPPRGFDISGSLDALSALKASGKVDALNVADNPRARGRMSALAMCALIQSRLGMETILHLALRHRNLVALHSDILGAHALGIRNILVVMGDLPRTGDYPEATAVSDITASGMVRLVNAFNSGVDLTGRSIEQATSFLVGCAFNPGALDMDRELRALERKVQAGAHFMLTQPVYDVFLIERAYRTLGGFPVPLFMGVLPLRSLRHADFLHNEVPGMTIPSEVRRRLELAGERAPQEGVRISQEVLSQVTDMAAGAYFIPPFGRYDVVLRVLEDVELKIA